MNTEEKRAYAADLGNKNQESYNELQAELKGNFEMDTSDFRRETFFQLLLEWGVITEDQMLDFEIKFHEGVWEQLESFWGQLRDAKAKAKLSKPSRVLLGPGGQPISSGGQ